MRVSAVEKEVDRICAERLQGDGRLEDNVFISSYSQSCQLDSCASREGRPQYSLKERQTVSLKSHAPLAAAANHTDTIRLMLLLLRRPVVCALQDLTRKRHFSNIFLLHLQNVPFFLKVHFFTLGVFF